MRSASDGEMPLPVSDTLTSIDGPVVGVVRTISRPPGGSIASMPLQRRLMITCSI